MAVTQLKGDRAVTQAIASFTREGMVVSIPVSESAQYDLVVDDGLKLNKVQVKYCGSKDGLLDLRRIHSNSKGYVTKFYSAGDFDLLYVLKGDGTEYVLSGASLENKRSIVPKEKHSFINWKGSLTGSRQHS